MPTYVKIATGVVLPIMGTLCCSLVDSVSNSQLIAKRNFYGVLSVKEVRDDKTGAVDRVLVHGNIVHGSQARSADAVLKPTTYYTALSGVGLAFERHLATSHRTIGVVGLGAGTLATYGKAGDHFRFYEINPDVTEFAKSYFSYLRDTSAEVDIVHGDARIALEGESPNGFDILVLDAFSGDAIPVHLLTREAMQIYVRHLKDNGILAIHISNLYFDLRRIVAGLAMDVGYEVCVVSDDEASLPGSFKSTWVLLSRDNAVLQEVIGSRKMVAPAGVPIHWTDDRSNLFDALR